MTKAVAPRVLSPMKEEMERRKAELCLGIRTPTDESGGCGGDDTCADERGGHEDRERKKAVKVGRDENECEHKHL